ncbi:MAG: outer membrane lipoprotein carrier protein LolA [Bryobacterales bacterium]|nr:outer membrane lipoprotein carrier protein LolA [Bryobacterales bacterium]
MLRIFLTILLAAGTLPAADFDLQRMLRRLEDRYNSIRTLQVNFEQTLSFSTQPTAKRMETGILILRKPGKMRWDYLTPTRKLFMSDGKFVYFYSVAANRVEKSKFKESDDMRAPLAFLIGKLDFQRDFREYHIQMVDGKRWVKAIPKSDKAPYREVHFLVNEDDASIRQLRVYGHDQSVMEFVFQNEKLNPQVDENAFVFRAPAGAEVVSVEGQ